ncbi:beta-1,4-galactosyltransferase 7 [Malaya genurostris]|uniref:beta-1,4-galactosyltransferase 7 n=1 Tax=Malaya genurostris TaxID=325434 RepID=UPI0026F39B17|nr:beta-1,4-galactosyltransferase 7 [Malaya genurostris]XP_058454279.1 beta-1,4-galactosyltransferase 7 [Malaya genurostris]
MLKTVYLRFVSIIVLTAIAVTVMISSLPLSTDICKCEELISDSKHEILHKSFQESSTSDKPKLAVLVPFRDRFDELLKFAPHISNFLTRQQIPFHIFVLNQNDRYRFNRASLINAGFLQVKDHYDYIAMHDVDLLPMNDNLKYEYPVDGPLHISGPEYHPKYHYATFIGGILLLRVDQFELLNGMSNRYWGWGLEDDEFYVRIKDAGLEVYRPRNISTGPENTFLHVHDRLHRRRDTVKCYEQREVTRRRDRETGLNTLLYSIERRYELTINQVPLTVLNINLQCDKTQTPWCECDSKIVSKSQTESKKKL